jgi:hypothetical protein
LSELADGETRPLARDAERSSSVVVEAGPAASPSQTDDDRDAPAAGERDGGSAFGRSVCPGAGDRVEVTPVGTRENLDAARADVR